jgi:hypothetical protein
MLTDRVSPALPDGRGGGSFDHGVLFAAVGERAMERLVEGLAGAAADTESAFAEAVDTIFDDDASWLAESLRAAGQVPV